MLMALLYYVGTSSLRNSDKMRTWKITTSYNQLKVY